MIHDLRSIGLDAATEQALAEVAREMAEVEALGEFSAEVRDELARNFLPDRISDTLNIESVRVNPRLTRAVLEGLSVSETDKYSELEILNVSAADDLISAEASSGTLVSPALIREIHRRIEAGLIPSAGSFREQDVTITGAAFHPPAWPEAREMVGKICDTLAAYQDGNAVLRAIWLHASIVRVHPFMDGNGRTARMLQDFLLIRAGLLPVGVPINRRAEYYVALERSDEGKYDDLVLLVANAELAALDKVKRVAQAPFERRARIERLIAAAKTRTRMTEYNQYEFWRRKVEGFFAEVSKWLDEMNSEADGFDLRYRTFDMQSFEKWCEIRDKGWATGTWQMLIDVTARNKLLYRFLFYAKRHRLDWVSESSDELRDSVGVFLDAAPAIDSKFELGRYVDPHLRLREIVFDRGQMIVFEDPESKLGPALPEGVVVTSTRQPWQRSEASTPAEVIETFLEDLLTKLGLID